MGVGLALCRLGGEARAGRMGGRLRGGDFAFLFVERAEVVADVDACVPKVYVIVERGHFVCYRPVELALHAQRHRRPHSATAYLRGRGGYFKLF